MSMRPWVSVEIPAQTVAVVQAACPGGTRVTRVRDALGPIFDDQEFAGWFAAEGRSAVAPGLLAMVCVLQAMEDLTDRDAADAVRTRMDWKYALGLALDDTGFHYSVLSEFRDRLAVDERAVRLLELMLDAAKRVGLLRGGGKARTDSTHVLAKISMLGRLERVGETVRAALNQLTQVAPGWLAPRIHPEWEQRYSRRIDSAHLPAAEQARDRFGQAVSADGAALLAAIDADPDAAWLNNLPAIDALRKIWDQECVLDQHGAWMLRHGRIREGADFLESPFDLDSRWSRKRDTTWQGYKAHLTETCDTSGPHLIIAVRTTSATDPDNATLPSISADLEARDLTPTEHYLDEGYVTADAVARAALQGTEIIGPLARDTSWQARAGRGFDRDSFRLDFDRRTAICPAGKISTTWKPRAHNSGPGTAIAFADTDCRLCPMRAHCTTSTTTGRQIVIPSRELSEIQLTTALPATTPTGSSATTPEPGSRAPSPQQPAPTTYAATVTPACPRPASNTSSPPAA
ncbi:transposase [Micromonospora sp. Llam7]|nr:transposase [Micromonospora tarapacensis]MBX7268753.1 transposase [Micromonospora tarapacensis]